MCVCKGSVMCGCFGNMYTVSFLILTEVFPCFFLSCKANDRVKLAKTGHGQHSSTLVVVCVVRLLFVLFYLLFVCKCVLPPGDNPTAVNKYIISYTISYHIKILLGFKYHECTLIYSNSEWVSEHPVLQEHEKK